MFTPDTKTGSSASASFRLGITFEVSGLDLCPLLQRATSIIDNTEWQTFNPGGSATYRVKGHHMKLDL